MEIPLRGEFTEQDIRRGLALMRGRAFQVAGIGIGILVPLCAVGSLLTAPEGWVDANFVLTSLLPALIVPAFFGIVMWWTVRRQVRQVQEAPLFQGTITGLATDEAIELQSAESASRIKWSAFVQYRMTDDVVLLYQNKAAATIVPRSLFPDDQAWQQFRQHVQATVPPKARKPSPQP